MDELLDLFEGVVPTAPVVVAAAKPAPVAAVAKPVVVATIAKPAPAAVAKSVPMPAPVAAAAPAVKPSIAAAAARYAPAVAKVKPAAVAATTAPAAAASATAVVDSGITISNMRDHARKKGMWAGALTRVSIPDLFGAKEVTETVEEDNELGETVTVVKKHTNVIEISSPHTPAMLKIIDEIIVNASDHANSTKVAQKVTTIDITFDMKTGMVTVRNDGSGIPVHVHEAASREAGHDVYSPEVSFSYFLAGTNIDKEADSTKGGTNGLGAKLMCVHSTEATLETVDAPRRLKYRQRFLDRLRKVEPPQITVMAAGERPFTLVSFVPAYAELGYEKGEGDSPLTAATAAEIDSWIRLRAHQAAAYVGARVAVTYNGEQIMTRDAAGLARLLAGPDAENTAEASKSVVISGIAKASEDPYKRHNWEIAVVVLPAGQKAGRRVASQMMAVVNGVVSCRGSHVAHLRKLFSEAIETRVRAATKRSRDEKALSTVEAMSGLRIVVCAPIPGADWGGQRKDELQVPREVLDRYVVAPTLLKRVADVAAERLLTAMGMRNAGPSLGITSSSKYTRARNAGSGCRGGNNRAKTRLFAAEGDSAITLLRSGMTQTKKAAPPGGPSFDWCGIISLQGVIINAAREVTSVATSDGGMINVRSAKLSENPRLAALAEAFGLRNDRTYKTAEERATLNYGQLILATDEDLDGKGKIAALVLVWIHLFWPALIANGCVGRFLTPLVRAFPRARGRGAAAAAGIVEFYYEQDFRKWADEDPARLAAHDIKYYKGLAAHTPADAKRMFTPEAFERAIYTYTLDDSAATLFNVYFGPESALRKAALVTPVRHLSPEEIERMRARREIPVGEVQLDIDTKSYKLDAIKRQIPGIDDGMNPARRKIIAGALDQFGKKADDIKVFQLGGRVAADYFYHHGESINNTIIYLAESFPGARIYPLLVGVGQYGTRYGNKAGSPRYVGVKLGKLARAIFPAADDWLLPYVEEDGQRAEPRTYMPVVPIAALEDSNNVSEGWSHVSYGRDLDAVIAVVEAFIAGEPRVTAAAERLRAEGPMAEVLAEVAAAWPALPPRLSGNGETVRNYKGVPYSFGAYKWFPATRTVVVTELPIGLATIDYLKTLGHDVNAAPTRAAPKSRAAAKPRAVKSRGTADENCNPRAELIESIRDYSTEQRVNLEIVLRPGAFEAICENFGDEEIDPIEDALMLRESRKPLLNYFSTQGSVLNFGDNYLAVILYWATSRRDLYFVRVERERIILTLRILENEATLRYIGESAALGLSKLADDDAAAAVLAAARYPMLDTALLHRPQATPNSELHKLVTAGPGASYNYLLNLRERDLLVAAAAKRRKALDALRAELAVVEGQLAEKPMPCASVWRREIARFVEVANAHRAAIAAGSAEEADEEVPAIEETA